MSSCLDESPNKAKQVKNSTTNNGENASVATAYTPISCSSVLQADESANTSRQNIEPVQRRKLTEFFDKIITHGSIDFSSQEIQDIQRAVHKIMERVVDRVNKRGIFHVARIEPGGSMVEKNGSVEIC